MRRCDQCGHVLKDTDRFCPQCGAPASQAEASPPPGGTGAAEAAPGSGTSAVREEAGTMAPPAPAGKTLGKTARILLIAAAAVAVLALIIAIGAGAVRNKPEVLVGEALGKTLESLASPEEGALGVLSRAASGGSLELAGDLSFLTDIFDLGPMEGSITVYLNAREGSLAVRLGLTCGVFDATDILFSLSPDEVVLDSSLLSRGPYGIRLTDAARNLDASIFAPGSGSYFELDEESFAALRGFLSPKRESPEALKEELARLSEKYIELLVKEAFEAGTADKRKVTLPIGSEEVKAAAVTLELDGKGLSRVLTALAEEIESDEELRRCAAELAKQAYSASTFFQILDSGYAWVDVLSNEEIEETAGQILDDFVRSAREAAHSLVTEDIRLRFEFYVARDTKTLAAFTVEAWQYGEKVYALDVTLGKNVFASEEVSLKVSNGWSECVIRYLVSDNSKNRYAARLTVDDGYENVTFTISWDKSTGAWRLAGDSWSMGGTLEQSGRKTTVSITRLEGEDVSLDIDFTLIIRESDPAPVPGAYTDLLALSEAQFEDIFYDLDDRYSGSALRVLVLILSLF